MTCTCHLSVCTLTTSTYCIKATAGTVLQLSTFYGSVAIHIQLIIVSVSYRLIKFHASYLAPFSIMEFCLVIDRDMGHNKETNIPAKGHKWKFMVCNACGLICGIMYAMTRLM